MKGERSSGHRKLPSPLFSKTAGEWMLSSALYDGIEDEDIRYGPRSKTDSATIIVVLLDQAFSQLSKKLH